MGVSYNRNMGLVLNVDLAGISEHGVAQTCIWSETQGFSDPRLKWSAKLLRTTLDMEREVTQTRVGQDTKLLRPASEVFMLRWTRDLRFSLKCDLHVEVRFVLDDLSLVIFGQSAEPPQKFSILHSWLGWISKYFRFWLNLGFSWLTGNLLRCPELNPVWIVVFVSVLLNFLKPPGKIIESVLETQSSSCHKLWFVHWCTIEPVELYLLLPVYYWTDCRSRDILFICERMQPS